MGRTVSEKLAAIIVQILINKLEKSKAKYDSNSFQVAYDLCVRKQKRYGWYCWVEYQGNLVEASSGDIPEHLLTENTVQDSIHYYFNNYTNYGNQPINNIDEFNKDCSDINFH